MARRNKLQKFAEILSYPHVYESYDIPNPVLTGKDGEQVHLKGQWGEKHFKNDHPITLELACGKGEYTIGLAEKYPNRNFIGVDIKGARIWRGAKLALEKKLTNVAFLRIRIEQISAFFDKDEIDEIWITFPDPFLRKSKANRRLTSSFFLNHYRQILKGNGVIHLKTDSTPLYEFTKEVLEEENIIATEDHSDIYAGELPHPDLGIKTFYEKMHLANQLKIKYIQFCLS